MSRGGTEEWLFPGPLCYRMTMEGEWVWRLRVLLVLGKEDPLLEIAGTSTSIIFFYILYRDSVLSLLFSAIFPRNGIVCAKLFSLLCHSCPHAHHPQAWMLPTGLEEDGMNLLSGCFAKIRVLVLFVLSYAPCYCVLGARSFTPNT